MKGAPKIFIVFLLILVVFQFIYEMLWQPTVEVESDYGSAAEYPSTFSDRAKEALSRLTAKFNVRMFFLFAGLFAVSWNLIKKKFKV
jgi:hypothetical protein